MLCESDPAPGGGLAGNLKASLQAFFELDDNAQLSKCEFIEYMKQICTVEQSAFLEHVFLTQKCGFLKMGEQNIKFQYNIVYGLRVKDHIMRICKVTNANFDQVYKLAAIQHTSLNAQYERILEMRKEVAALQISLASITFQIMSADQVRFKQLKKRNKQIEQVKRAVRRTERQQM